MKYQNLFAALRKEHGLSRRDIGHLLDRSGDSVAGYENGTEVPPTAISLRLQFLFGVPVAEMLPAFYEAVILETVPAIQRFSVALEIEGDRAHRKRDFVRALGDRLERLLPHA